VETAASSLPASFAAHPRSGACSPHNRHNPVWTACFDPFHSAKKKKLVRRVPERASPAVLPCSYCSYAQQCAWSTEPPLVMSAFDNRQLFPPTTSLPQPAPHSGWSSARHNTAHGAALLGRVDPWQVVEARLQEVSARVQSMRRARAAAVHAAPAAAAQPSESSEEVAAARSVVRPTPPHLVFAPAGGAAHDNPPPPPQPLVGVASAPPLPATSPPAGRSQGGGDYSAALSAAESVIRRVTAGTLGDTGGPLTPL
jgi:hypothetical protein